MRILSKNLFYRDKLVYSLDHWYTAIKQGDYMYSACIQGSVRYDPRPGTPKPGTTCERCLRILDAHSVKNNS